MKFWRSWFVWKYCSGFWIMQMRLWKYQQWICTVLWFRLVFISSKLYFCQKNICRTKYWLFLKKMTQTLLANRESKRHNNWWAGRWCSGRFSSRKLVASRHCPVTGYTHSCYGCEWIYTFLAISGLVVSDIG